MLSKDLRYVIRVLRKTPVFTITAVVTIGMFKYSAGASALISALNDSSQTVRKQAAWALGEIGASASVAGGPLQNAATNDSSPLVRSLAKAALTKLQ